MSSFAAMGAGATDLFRKQGRRRRAIYPCILNRDGATHSPPRENSPRDKSPNGQENEHTRHVGTTWRP
ncbi:MULTISPECIES: hypothetical protein [Photorhabdus]|uniref:hypothetical protein n=1 Tax=Photorhabdus TaxID=29487 RepID=UPI00139691DC|nr:MULTISPECIES: hypothetical protein [Photorhabdus]